MPDYLSKKRSLTKLYLKCIGLPFSDFDLQLSLNKFATSE